MESDLWTLCSSQLDCLRAMSPEPPRRSDLLLWRHWIIDRVRLNGFRCATIECVCVCKRQTTRHSESKTIKKNTGGSLMNYRECIDLAGSGWYTRKHTLTRRKMEGEVDDEDGMFTNISLADDSGKGSACHILMFAHLSSEATFGL